MRARFAQKILPLALCFALGVGLAGAGQRISDGRPAESESHSRTWLVIKSKLPPRRPVVGGGAGSVSSARFRARFGEDGTVSAVVRLPQPGADEGWTPTEPAVENIEFTPPTEDGRRLAVTADILCEAAGASLPAGALGIEYIDARPLISLSVRIVSVEGASSQEGWRVVYE